MGFWDFLFGTESQAKNVLSMTPQQLAMMNLFGSMLERQAEGSNVDRGVNRFESIWGRAPWEGPVYSELPRSTGFGPVGPQGPTGLSSPATEPQFIIPGSTTPVGPQGPTGHMPPVSFPTTPLPTTPVGPQGPTGLKTPPSSPIKLPPPIGPIFISPTGPPQIGPLGPAGPTGPPPPDAVPKGTFFGGLGSLPGAGAFPHLTELTWDTGAPVTAADLEAISRWGLSLFDRGGHVLGSPAGHVLGLLQPGEVVIPRSKVSSIPRQVLRSLPKFDSGVGSPIGSSRRRVLGLPVRQVLGSLPKFDRGGSVLRRGTAEPESELVGTAASIGTSEGVPEQFEFMPEQFGSSPEVIVTRQYDESYPGLSDWEVGDVLGSPTGQAVLEANADLDVSLPSATPQSLANLALPVYPGMPEYLKQYTVTPTESAALTALESAAGGQDILSYFQDQIWPTIASRYAAMGLERSTDLGQEMGRQLRALSLEDFNRRLNAATAALQYGGLPRDIALQQQERAMAEWLRTSPEASPYLNYMLSFMGMQPYNTAVVPGSPGLINSLAGVVSVGI